QTDHHERGGWQTEREDLLGHEWDLPLRLGKKLENNLFRTIIGERAETLQRSVAARVFILSPSPWNNFI
ncbi:MAG: hypothetical protein OSB83_08365, partial [Planctomycetota bacterium]|nr:hypothetical protein [Planctomycetota bacterium]